MKETKTFSFRRATMNFFIGIYFIVLPFGGLDAKGQQPDCQVLIPALSGSYSGKCKNGFANGNGIAIGTDKYEGQFLKGLPHGKGTYTWSNGSWYEGKWLEGKRDGKGQMTYHLESRDSIVSGFWKLDKYMGERLIPPYTVKMNIGVIRYNFRKIPGTGNNLTIKFLIGGRVNSDIQDLSVTYDSGSEFWAGTTLGIQSIIYPLEMKITYRSWNLLHTSLNNVNFEFTITEPSTWEITINN